jgi:RNA polymerase sigma-70 factor, ECF subfamily
MEAGHVELLWEGYAGRLLGFIRSRVPSPEEAEDILQEVFVRIHTGLCCLQEEPAMERWIYRVARNLIIDRYRARKATAELDEGAAAPEAPMALEVEDDPVARLAFSLRETVEELPEPYREALILTEYGGLSQAEYAERAGISLSGAKSRVQRARARLKELLLECCHFELDRLGGIIEYYPRCCCCSRERLAPRRPLRRG